MKPKANPLSGLSLAKLLFGLAVVAGVSPSAVAQQVNQESFLLERAKFGSPEDQHNLGVHYFKDSGSRAVRTTEAIYWFERAASQDFLPSIRALIEIYTTNPKLKVAPRELARLLERAGELGDTPASTQLGVMLWAGAEGVPRDIKRAYQLLCRESLRGDETATLFLIARALDGSGLQRDPVKAAELLRALALRGSATARVQSFFLKNESTTLDPIAVLLPRLMMLADQGDARAMYLAGVAIEARLAPANGAQDSHAAAFTWFAKAAEKNDPDALYRLGQAARLTAKTPEEFRHAADLLERAATDGAKLQLAKLILEDKIPDPAPTRLLGLLESAGATEPEALFELGMIHYEGRQGIRNVPKAVDFFTRAAQGINPKSCINLGVIAINGEAGPADLTEAAMWWQLALSAGSSEAGSYLKRIQGRLSAREKANAKQRAMEWIENLQRRRLDSYPKLAS